MAHPFSLYDALQTNMAGALVVYWWDGYEFNPLSLACHLKGQNYKRVVELADKALKKVN